MDEQNSLNIEVQRILDSLYDIAPLAISDFDPKDNILKSTQDMLDSVNWILGSEFDEHVSESLKEINHLINELQYKQIQPVSIRKDLSTVLLLNKYINNYLMYINKDFTVVSLDDIRDAMLDIKHQSYISFKCIDISMNQMMDLYNYLGNKKDKAYECSKDLVRCIKSRIEYNFSHNQYFIKDNCYEAMSGIFFLIKYYSACSFAFTNLLSFIYSDLSQTLKDKNKVQ